MHSLSIKFIQGELLNLEQLEQQKITAEFAHAMHSVHLTRESYENIIAEENNVFSFELIRYNEKAHCSAMYTEASQGSACQNEIGGEWHEENALPKKPKRVHLQIRLLYLNQI
jgi:hypothetical protein